MKKSPYTPQQINVAIDLINELDHVHGRYVPDEIKDRIKTILADSIGNVYTRGDLKDLFDEAQSPTFIGSYEYFEDWENKKDIYPERILSFKHWNTGVVDVCGNNRDYQKWVRNHLSDGMWFIYQAQNRKGVIIELRKSVNGKEIMSIEVRPNVDEIRVGFKDINALINIDQINL